MTHNARKELTLVLLRHQQTAIEKNANLHLKCSETIKHQHLIFVIRN